MRPALFAVMLFQFKRRKLLDANNTDELAKRYRVHRPSRILDTVPSDVERLKYNGAGQQIPDQASWSPHIPCGVPLMRTSHMY